MIDNVRNRLDAFLVPEAAGEDTRAWMSRNRVDNLVGGVLVREGRLTAEKLLGTSGEVESCID